MGRPGRSGSTFTCGGGTAASFGHAEPDSPQIHAKDTIEKGRYISNPALVSILTQQAPGQVQWLGTLGLEYWKTQGLYCQNRGLGQSVPRNCTPKGNGAALAKTLINEAAWRGARLLSFVRVIGLMQSADRLLGAAALDLNSGVRIAIGAKAVILANGSATGLYPGSSAAYPSYGDSFRLAHQLGACLENMEFLEFTFAPVVEGRLTSVGGSTQLTARGARFLNALGQDIQQLYAIADNDLTRATLTKAFWEEEQAGHGPVRLDLTSISAKAWKDWESLGHPFLTFLKAAYGQERHRAKIDVSIALHCHLGGVVIDEMGRTNIPGLFAAGEAATGLHGAVRLGGNAIAECLVFGRRASLAAAAYCQEQLWAIKPAALRKELNKIFASFAGSEGSGSINIEVLERLVQKAKSLAGSYLGPIRSALGLKKAVNAYQKLLSTSETLRASDKTCLAKLADLRGLSLTGYLTASAALRRKESRGCHCRSDFPQESSKVCA
jgi:succinate dehydrogenase/fumarate reductase flavoprotein subunit